MITQEFMIEMSAKSNLTETEYLACTLESKLHKFNNSEYEEMFDIHDEIMGAIYAIQQCKEYLDRVSIKVRGCKASQINKSI